ncbi:MAG TPA: NUDIX domain-containing protein [Streptosporangiaceae bacterium]|nr:NUDIX domain-containing protein [Streptosporangiaceae bacterium]
MAADGVRIPVWSGGQQWLVSCHPPPDPPDGTPHGGEGVCVTADGDIVVISPDGTIWDLPAGRPEPGDSWEQTLRREMDEEACATVVSARLLGVTRGQCVAGPERGRVLVRSVWRADVELRPWEVRFEIAERRVVAPGAVEDALSLGSQPFAPFIRRELQEAAARLPVACSLITISIRTSRRCGSSARRLRACCGWTTAPRSARRTTAESCCGKAPA